MSTKKDVNKKAAVVEKAAVEEKAGTTEPVKDDLTELDALIQAETPELGPDYDPAVDELKDKVAVAENKQAELAATGQSMVAVAIIGEVIAMIRPDLVVSDEQKTQVQQKLALVLLKYSTGGVPPWLLKYREELELAGVLGMVGFGMVQQVKAAEAANDQQGVEDGKQSESQAS
jgi:hypothetical protein